MPVDCQFCLVPGVKQVYFKLKHMRNALVNVDRTVQDELSMDYILIDVTNNTISKKFTLKILAHNWVFSWWWRGYVAVTFVGSFWMLWAYST